MLFVISLLIFLLLYLSFTLSPLDKNCFCKRTNPISQSASNGNQIIDIVNSRDQLNLEDLPKYDDLQKMDILKAQTSSTNQEKINVNVTAKDLPDYNELKSFAQS